MTTYLHSIFGGHQNHPTTTPTPIQTTTRSQTQRSKSHSRSHSVPTVNGATTAYIYSTPSATSSSSYPRKRSQSFSARAIAPSPLRYGTLHEPGAGGSGYPVSEDDRYHSSRERVLLPRRASYKTSDHGGSLILSFLPPSFTHVNLFNFSWWWTTFCIRTLVGGIYELSLQLQLVGPACSGPCPVQLKRQQDVPAKTPYSVPSFVGRQQRSLAPRP